MIRGTKQIIPTKVNKDINLSIHNRFDVEVIDTKTGKIRQKAQAHNVICNELWRALFDTTDSISAIYFYRIAYGSGSGTPNVNDTSLFKQEGYKEAYNPSYDGDYDGLNNTYNWDWDTGVLSRTKKVTLSETELVGVTLTEVGLLSGSGKTSTHAMLKDMNGNEVSIEKTSTDIINIYATIFVHFNPDGYSNSSILMYFWSSGALTYTIKEYYINNVFSILVGARSIYYISNKDLQCIYHGNSLLSPGDNSIYDGSDYTRVTSKIQSSAESKEITISSDRLAADKGNNLGGILYLGFATKTIGSSDSYSFYIRTGEGSWYPYTQITGEAVATGDGTTKDFALKFPKAHDAKIYLDGEESEAVVDYIPNKMDTFSLIPVIKIFSADKFLPGFIESSSYWGNPFVVYNPWYESHGISGVVRDGTNVITVKVSNDLVDWILLDNLTLISGVYQIPEEYQHYKYYSIPNRRISTTTIFVFTPEFTGKAIHFDTPPAEGVVITADYKTDCIAKDENHVFDFSLTMHLGEYSGS